MEESDRVKPILFCVHIYGRKEGDGARVGCGGRRLALIQIRPFDVAAQIFFSSRNTIRTEDDKFWFHGTMHQVTLQEHQDNHRQAEFQALLTKIS